MVNVCAHYNGTIILLAEFETEEDAKEFMQHDYILYHADELEDAEDDELIYKDQMFIDNGKEIPFSEPFEINELLWDELPF